MLASQCSNIHRCTFELRSGKNLRFTAGQRLLNMLIPRAFFEVPASQRTQNLSSRKKIRAQQRVTTNWPQSFYYYSNTASVSVRTKWLKIKPNTSVAAGAKWNLRGSPSKIPWVNLRHFSSVIYSNENHGFSCCSFLLLLLISST